MTNLTSHLGVYALILNAERTHALVIHKIRGPYTGRYDLPGGTPDDNEKLEETLMREIMEETGCMVVNYTQLGAFSTRFDYQDAHKGPSRLRHIGVLYHATVSGKPREDGDGQDSGGCTWLDIREPLDEELVSPFLPIALAARTKKS
jgi:8-oxo-dGTP diphosphatase